MTPSQLRQAIRPDLKFVADMIAPNSRVLDVGCGDGALLDYLTKVKNIDGRGIELSAEGVNACVSAGLSVIQGDADTDLKDYPDAAFDYVILSQTLQATWQPQTVLGHMLRIGKRAVVSFPNFGHWRVRWYLGVHGRMPVNEALPHQWYDTPNIHLCTIKDFIALCDAQEFTIERSVALTAEGELLRIGSGVFLANLLGEQAVFLLSKR